MEHDIEDASLSFGDNRERCPENEIEQSASRHLIGHHAYTVRYGLPDQRFFPVRRSQAFKIIQQQIDIGTTIRHRDKYNGGCH
jgi:hypothetical protein